MPNDHICDKAREAVKGALSLPHSVYYAATFKLPMNPAVAETEGPFAQSPAVTCEGVAYSENLSDANIVMGNPDMQKAAQDIRWALRPVQGGALPGWDAKNPPDLRLEFFRHGICPTKANPEATCSRNVSVTYAPNLDTGAVEFYNTSVGAVPEGAQRVGSGVALQPFVPGM
jgi:hypothetical protein